MNKTLIGLALALSIPLTALAEAGQKSQECRWHGPRMERLTKELNLTDQQKAQVETIFKEQKEKYKAIHEETRTRLKSVLTEEQMTKMDEMRQRRLERWKKGDQPVGKP